jgi:hypothetical protein
MSSPPAVRVPTPPARIVRVAARRVIERPGKPKRPPVVLTIGVPQRVPGWDWGCAVQITGLGRSLSRPQFVFGADGFQALYLAIQHASVTLEVEAKERRLPWIEAYGLPRFLPPLPKPQQDELQRLVDREVRRIYTEAAKRARARARSASRAATTPAGRPAGARRVRVAKRKA